MALADEELWGIICLWTLAPVVAFISSAGCGISKSQEILLDFTEVRSWQCIPIFPLLSVSFSLFYFSLPACYCHVPIVFFCVVLTFFLCSILPHTLLEAFLSPLPTPEIWTCLSQYALVFSSLSYSISRQIFCVITPSLTVEFFRMIRWTISHPPPFPFSFSSSYSPLTGTVWQRLWPLLHLQYSILLPESLSQVPLCW